MIYDYVVVGGGIAGVSCVENLAILNPDKRILLISSSPIIKAVINLRQLTRILEDFEVFEKPSHELSTQYPNITILHKLVSTFDSNQKTITTDDFNTISYQKLCICTGAKPKIIAENNEHVIGIRDTETIANFENKMKNAERIMVVGNGGIATELVFKIHSCEIIWAIKDDSIVSTFVDPGASKFLLSQMFNQNVEEDVIVKRPKYFLERIEQKQIKDSKCNSNKFKKKQASGCALGPDWTDVLFAHGNKTSILNSGKKNIIIERSVEVEEILFKQQLIDRNLEEKLLQDSTYLENQKTWPLYILLTNSKIYGCDFIVSATGVIPSVWPFLNPDDFKNKNKTSIRIAEDGGIKVNDKMQTSIDNVFAAGDVCTASWDHSPYWLQMRLWSQARQMGMYAAKCMTHDLIGTIDDVQLDFCFELFAHVTKFFNFKVVLLGRFNGQNLDEKYKLLIRLIEGKEYVKAVLQNDRLVGAVLIGETDLEETFENLILNKLDLSRYGDDLLTQDIEDYFD